MPRVLRDDDGYPIIIGSDVRPPENIVDDGGSTGIGGQFSDEFGDEFDAAPSTTSPGQEIKDDNPAENIVDDGILVAIPGEVQYGPYVPSAAASGETGLAFIVASIEAVLPAVSGGGGALALAVAWNVVPWNTLSLTPNIDAPKTTTTINASDVGYVTRSTDFGGTMPFPPLITEAYRIDREIDLDPTKGVVGWGWGALSLTNSDGRFDNIVQTWNTDGRRMTINRGVKTWDDTRGIWLDPSRSALVPLFAGMSQPWLLSANVLSVPVRDATYWLEKPFQPNTYTGAGTYQGNAALTGKPVPRTRGGTNANPIKNISPVLIDPTPAGGGGPIYQYNDGPGTVVALWEGGKATYNVDTPADVSDLYIGTPPASGYYRTDNSRGLLQLGSTPFYTLTLDVTGSFPNGGPISNIVDIAKFILTEDLALPAGNLDSASFDTAASTYNYVGGLYFHPDDVVDGVTAVSRALLAIGAKLIPDRTGKLRCFVLRAPEAAAQQRRLTITTENCVSVTPVTLPTNVDPPAYRVRVAWQHNYTVQASGLNPSDPVDEAARLQLQFAALPERYAGKLLADIATSYLKPNDIGPLGGALLIEANAQTVANELGDLWGTRRRLYDVELPVSVGITTDLGNYVTIIFPMDDLRNGQTGQVVGERYDSISATTTLRVLV